MFVAAVSNSVLQLSKQGSLGPLETSYSDRAANTLRSKERDLKEIYRNDSVPVCFFAAILNTVLQLSQQGSLGSLETTYRDRVVNTLRSKESDLKAMDRNESVPLCL